MNYYFLDLENICARALKSFSTLNKDDKVFIFYSETCKKTNFDDIAGILDRTPALHLIKAEAGKKNALDFQLDTYLGYEIGQNKNKNNNIKYYIVAKDKGYNVVCNFWEEKGINIKQTSAEELPNIIKKDKNEKNTNKNKENKAKKKKKAKKVQKKDKLKLKEVKAIIHNDKDAQNVINILNTHTTQAEILAALSNRYKGKKNALPIFEQIKPLMKKANKT